MVKKTRKTTVTQKQVGKHSKSRRKRYRLKYKIRWKAVIPLFFLLVLFFYLIGSFIFSFLPWNRMTTVCGFNKEKTLEVMNNRYEASYTIADYFFYGEVLNIYPSDYTGNQHDLQGKKIILQNLCDQMTYTFQIGEKVDEQILVTELTAGFYSMFVESETGAKLRLVYDEVLSENSFTTIPRDNLVKKVVLHSDPAYLGNNKYVFDKNYLFLEVREEKASKDMIDVVIDPYGNNRDEGNQLDQGQVYHNIAEFKESYTTALQLKEKLEQKGLRVAITKQSATEETVAYGENSRFKEAYEKQAKYYIKLGFNGSPYEDAKGMEVTYSSYTTDVFAQKVWKYMIEHTALQGSTFQQPDKEYPGLLSSPRIEGIDGQKIYDSSLALRETGGKATFAAMYSQESQENSFVKDLHYGMQGLDIDLLYLSNQEDITLWKEQKQSLIEELSKALIHALNIQSE